MGRYHRTIFFCIASILAISEVHAQDKIAQIFQSEMLNAQLPYVESIIGPAMHVYPLGGVQSRDYRVQGCRVTAYTKGATVIGYALDLASRCNFNLGAFLGNGYTSTSGLTIGRFASGSFGPDLSVNSSCIYLCGNAADPTVDFTFEGPHAVNYVSIVLTVILATDSSIDAADKWRTFMLKREGEDYISNTRFNCDQKYSDEAVSDFANVAVSRITVGYEPAAAFYSKGCRRR